VAVVERDARASSASVRNFGFVTITGQQDGVTRERTLRSRETWSEVAAAAGIELHQRGALIAARRPEAMQVLAQYARSPAGAACELLDAAGARARLPQLCRDVAGALWSPHELRVEAREAIPALSRWLEAEYGVTFLWGTSAHRVEPGVLHHARGRVEADAIVVAPGGGVAALAPQIARRARVRQCKLQMLRLAGPGLRLPGVLMSDLSLVRYGGFAAQPAASELRARLERECASELANGVHLIVAQATDGTLVVGDSHHEAETEDPFASAAVDHLVLSELGRLLEISTPRVLERWNGYYPVADTHPLLSEALAARVQLVVVTSGTGMSTGFAIGEETIDQLFGTRPSR
jgi:FAD dependent oxidoreductase TIGR03364